MHKTLKIGLLLACISTIALAQTPARTPETVTITSGPLRGQAPIGADAIRVDRAAIEAAAAQTTRPLEQSFEHRFQMDYQVNAAALAKFLPAGFAAAPAATGAAKDCNLRVIFVDRMNIVGPDNRVLGKGSARLVYLEVPVRETATGATGRMVIGAITDNAGDVPGVFGNALLATTASMNRSVSADNGVQSASEDWEFAAASGERIRMHVAYTPAAANKGGGAQTKLFDPRDPTKFLLSVTEQATDIARNVTTTPADRVKEYSFSAGGGKFAALFDGTEKPLSWDAQRGYVRTLGTPQ